MKNMCYYPIKRRDFNERQYKRCNCKKFAFLYELSATNNIEKNLLFYRKNNKITQKKLAEKLGVKHNAISSWKNGVNSIDIDTLFRVCQIFGITVNDMYGMSNDNKPSTIAAHFDGDEYTEDELDEIRQFAEFVKNKRK